MLETEKTVKQLNSFLRGELSAVETYKQAIPKVKETHLRSQLSDCLADHQRRVELIATRVKEMGGQPSEGSGAWGAFAKIVEAVATAAGDKAAISALEEGEDHGMNDYRSLDEDLDPTLRSFVESELLPAQKRTHQTMSKLKHSVH